MLKRRHAFFWLRSSVLRHSCGPLFIHCQNCQWHNVHVHSSYAVPINRINCEDCQRVEESNGCPLQPLSVSKRYYKSLCYSVNVEPSTVHAIRSADAVVHSAGARRYSRLRPNVRWFTLSPKAIVEASPVYFQPYLRLIRLDRPIGTWLLFLPSAWSLTLATPVGQLPDVGLLTLFALGSFMMRSAGCTINDMWDKDFDIHVERTKDRPIACGELTRLKAFAFLGLPLSASLAILLTLNWNTMMLGFAAMFPVIVYPLMKRITYWPQAFLGITFNYGALMAWSAVQGCLDWPVIPLYLSCFAWTIIYDSIYAFQDKKYDAQIGVKSTAQRFNDRPRLWLAGFTSVMTCGLAGTGWLCQQTWPYYLGVGLFAAHLGHQVYTVDVNDPKDCGKKFRSNRNIGLIFWALILASSLYNYKKAVKRDSTDDRLSDHDRI